MLFSHYQETTLEKSISKHYRLHRFWSAEALLDIDRIAETFDVDLRYDTCKSVSDNNEKIIILDKRLTGLQRRKIFFHELCHVLRHAGDQRKMPALFREGQEAEAENFVLYASMPFYMISKLKIPDRQDEGVQFLSSTFKVPLKLAKRKLEQIQRRELQGILILETARLTLNEPCH